MKLYKKEGNIIQILSFPTETVEKGDYLLIDDLHKSLIVQVIDIQFANVPGILEELLRTLPGSDVIHGEDYDPLGISPSVLRIQDAVLLICKIRATIANERLIPNSSWLPSRSHAKIKKLTIPTLLALDQVDNQRPIMLGITKDSSPLTIDASLLDGRLNIITGKKETGKSHLSKLLMLSLITFKAILIVLDLNGEYVGLGIGKDGKQNAFHHKIHVLTPARNFKVMFKHVNLPILLDIFIHALHLPGTSAREFGRIWQSLNERGSLDLRQLGLEIRHWHCNLHVRDALYTRYHSLINTRFFTDNRDEATVFEDCLSKAKMNGGALIINLRNTSAIDRQIVVEYLLSTLVELLKRWELPAVFLLAEEAHLYLRETYWEDIVTRMRHFGIFTTFITNQPDTIRENIYRQADNIFLFNFTNSRDLDVVSRAARVDSETVKSIASDLPPHHCLVLGKVVNDFPMIVKVQGLNVKTMGKTRLFFNN